MGWLTNGFMLFIILCIEGVDDEQYVFVRIMISNKSTLDTTINAYLSSSFYSSWVQQIASFIRIKDRPFLTHYGTSPFNYQRHIEMTTLQSNTHNCNR